MEGLIIKWDYNVGIGTEGKEGGEEKIIMGKIESIREDDCGGKSELRRI